jgi:hypothetical protein
MVAYPLQGFDVYEDLVDSLELTGAQREDAMRFLRGVDEGAYVGGLTPKVWGAYARQTLGEEAGAAFDQFAEGLGPFRLGKPMMLRDVVVVSMWLWRRVFPELSLDDGCQQVIRECIEGITKSPGFGILLMVLDQGLVEVVKMSEAITVALTSFSAQVDASEQGVIKIELKNLNYRFLSTCLVGYFLGLIDMTKDKAEITCLAQGERGGVLTIRYQERG